MSSTRINWSALKERVTIPMLLERYERLRFMTEGDDGSYSGPCPIHVNNPNRSDSTSFKITPSGRGFKCFGCGAKGSIIDLVAGLEGVSPIRAGQLIHEWFPASAGDTSEERKASRLDCSKSSSWAGAETSAMLAASAERYSPDVQLIGLFYNENQEFRGEQVLAEGPLGAQDNVFSGFAESAALLGARLKFKAHFVILLFRNGSPVVTPKETRVLRLCHTGFGGAEAGLTKKLLCYHVHDGEAIQLELAPLC